MRLVQQDLDYQKLYNLYKVQQIPSVIIIKPNGTEVDRIVDISNYKKQYTNFLIDSYEGKNSYADLKESFEKDPNNLELAFQLFTKDLARGEIEGIVNTGKIILEIENTIDKNKLSKNQKTIFEKTHFHIRTSLFRFGKETVLNYFSEFPSVKFSKNIYRFLAFTYSKSEQSVKADNFYSKALQDFPEEYDFQKYYLKYCVNTKSQIVKATKLAKLMVNQKNFNDVTVSKLYQELKELNSSFNN